MFYILSIIVSIVLLSASVFQLIPLSTVEVLGFITGGLCVWLTVKENIWNWPIGIANAIFFTILFWNARLFADMGLQVIYIILGFLGWYWWLFGGKDKKELPISHVSRREVVILSALTIVATVAMTFSLMHVHDSAPFLDALTTVLSLVAQFLLTKKYIENWYIWITADVIYIGLYAFKSLYLTSILYMIFLTMCIIGFKQWNVTLKNRGDELV